ncbi:putative efflux protein, MATE family [Halobacteroides halobius DSM 5150]|uniref:Probable multidrug resistance protein NorM n=1 Tax=Halobacteroides halobius (strain ATCC 35273 / DSM 5150 / MD-1) TaxID=748449 RepID=L0KAG5_HALHC|nr:MATE family efflux transporter [Halobacteroides halobius]AGB42006.1 putative efflux protein, MATE family [Halobacteroides halobius DSM 5150]
MGQSELKKEIINLSVPAIGEMFLQLALINADTIMLGRLGGVALAAAGLSKQLAGINTIILFAIATGTTALVARYVGAKDYSLASKVVNQSILIGLLLGGLIFGVGFFLASVSLKLLGAKPEVLNLGVDYLKIILSSVIPAALMIIGNSVLRAGGDTKSPMIVTGVINIINIVGNYLLIFGIGVLPKLGLIGAGVATLVARSVGVGIVIWRLVNNQFGIELNYKQILKFDFKVLKQILRIGIPSAFERFAFKGGQLVIMRVIAILGTVAVATRQIALSIETFSILPSYGLSIATTTLVGQKLGAKRDDEAKEGSLLANKFGILATLVLGGLFFLFPKQLARIYTSDPKLIPKAALCLQILALAQPAKALNMILGGTFRGAGDTKFPMYLTFIGVWGLSLPLTYLLGVKLSLGLVGIWLAMVVDEWFRALVCIYRFNTNKWNRVELNQLPG